MAGKGWIQKYSGTRGGGTSRSDDMGGHGNKVPNVGAGRKANWPKMKSVGGMADTVQPGGEPTGGDQGSMTRR